MTIVSALRTNIPDQGITDMAEFLHGPWPLTLYALILTLLCGYAFFGRTGANPKAGVARLFLLVVSIFCACLIAAHFVE